MLKILDIKELPDDKEYIQVPWDSYFIDKKVTKYLDNSDSKIVADVEKTSLINNETIHGKFSDMPIGIGCLSEGCKTLLCINHAIKTGTINQHIFNITACGGNAVEYLATVMTADIDVYACIEHEDLGVFDNVHVEIAGEIFTDAINASTRLIELQGA